MSAKLTAKVEQEKQENGVKSPTWRNAGGKEAPPPARSPVKSAPKEPPRQKEANGRTTNGLQEVKNEVNGQPEAPWRQGRAGAVRKEAGNKEAGGSRREEQLAKVQEFLADPRSQGAGEPVALDVRLRKTGEQGKGPAEWIGGRGGGHRAGKRPIVGVLAGQGNGSAGQIPVYGSLFPLSYLTWNLKI